jgi:hypothetical protein
VSSKLSTHHDEIRTCTEPLCHITRACDTPITNNKSIDTMGSISTFTNGRELLWFQSTAAAT